MAFATMQALQAPAVAGSASSFLASKPATSSAASLGGVKLASAAANKARVTCATGDRWAGLANDYSDDQQDITRGKGLVDAAFQGGWGQGTQVAVLSTYDYVSQGQRNFNNITTEGFYISHSFMDKMVVHLCKNFMKLPNIKVPLILGIWGGKGQGKSFQCELVFAKMGINPIVMSAGELESGNAGEPAKLIRQRYREAADVIKKGKMCALFINDLDAGAGRMGGTTQYTVNNQMVNATLMNIADNPTNVQMPGIYNKEEIPRVPIIVTGNDFSTLYAPLIRDGRMEKFYWAPTREDRIGVCKGIFREDNVNEADVVELVDTFPGQSIDFFGALRARVYDDLVRNWVATVGIDQMGKKLVNSREGPPKFDRPSMTLDVLLQYGHMLVQEQENVKRVQLAETYLMEAALGDANRDAMQQGTFDGRPGSAPRPASNGASKAAAPPPPRPAAAAPPPPAAAPAPAAPKATGSQNLESLSLSELRALARSKGLRGDTKKELIQILSSQNGAAAPASAAAPVLSRAELEGKSMSELRAIASPRGIRGDTRAELIKALAG